MKRHIIALTTLCALATGGAVIHAQQTTGKDAANKTHLVNTAAELMTGKQLPSGNSFLTLMRSVIITSEDSTLTTEKATYNQDTQIANAPTRLRLEDKQNTLTADKGIAYYGTRDADFTGNVVINARPKPGDGAGAPKGSLRRNFKDPVTINCGHVRYNWRAKKAVLTENLVVNQANRTLTGDRGLYDGVAETVTLVGHIKETRSTGESLTVPGAKARLVASFKAGAEAIQITSDPDLKKIHGVIPVREKGDGEVEMIDTPDAPATTPPATVPTPPVGNGAPKVPGGAPKVPGGAPLPVAPPVLVPVPPTESPR